MSSRDFIGHVNGCTRNTRHKYRSCVCVCLKTDENGRFIKVSKIYGYTIFLNYGKLVVFTHALSFKPSHIVGGGAASLQIPEANEGLNGKTMLLQRVYIYIYTLMINTCIHMCVYM